MIERLKKLKKIEEKEIKEIQKTTINHLISGRVIKSVIIVSIVRLSEVEALLLQASTSLSLTETSSFLRYHTFCITTLIF
ncbi:hypothetical protein CAPN001_19590 [Capnocytophaga stomatis]|nr:hypothetical protein CAPN001_19590 [Capnocytophaga stomatis]